MLRNKDTSYGSVWIGIMAKNYASVKPKKKKKTNQMSRRYLRSYKNISHRLLMVEME